jgi:hypothetical protein
VGRDRHRRHPDRRLRGPAHHRRHRGRAGPRAGPRPLPFDEADQKAYDRAGSAYTHDALAEFQVNSATHGWFKQIGPGAQVTGKLVFDLPGSSSLAAVELHATPASAGIRVPLA